MTLYMIGLGLFDEKDITVRGLETVRRCEKVYLETYTSRLSVGTDRLSAFYGKEIIEADRELVESRAEETILSDAKDKETAFLVIGDPFGATTHADLWMRAKGLGIEVITINNASILSAVGIAGLELYKYGKTTSIPFHNKDITTPLEVFRKNDSMGLHTLFLLDLDPKSGRYMRISEALAFLLSNGLQKDRLCVGCAGIGAKIPEVVAMKAKDLEMHPFTLLPQCLIIPGAMHFMEEDVLRAWRKEREQ